MNIEDLTAYEQIEARDIKEVNSYARLLTHKKTGARIVLMENDDENKVFYIGFRTPPKESTGVMHILEHSVLCGSKEFPVKDPFIELAKGSLNTFLNAMTYPDKTVYPVASCNDKDFQNLTRSHGRFQTPNPSLLIYVGDRSYIYDNRVIIIFRNSPLEVIVRSISGEEAKAARQDYEYLKSAKNNR